MHVCACVSVCVCVHTRVCLLHYVQLDDELPEGRDCMCQIPLNTAPSPEMGCNKIFACVLGAILSSGALGYSDKQTTTPVLMIPVKTCGL